MGVQDLRFSRSAEIEFDHLARAHCGNLYIPIVAMERLHLDLPSFLSIFWSDFSRLFFGSSFLRNPCRISRLSG